MWSDPIADMLTRIRNAALIRKREVKIPSSLLKVAVAGVLHAEGYIEGFDQIPDERQGILRVRLKYGPRGEKVLRFLKRESKSGCRKYCKAGDLPRVLDGMGICIVSTNIGVVSDRVCRERNVGGELLCTVY